MKIYHDNILLPYSNHCPNHEQVYLSFDFFFIDSGKTHNDIYAYCNMNCHFKCCIFLLLDRNIFENILIKYICIRSIIKIDYMIMVKIYHCFSITILCDYFNRWFFKTIFNKDMLLPNGYGYVYLFIQAGKDYEFTYLNMY